jgi:cysteine synthase
MRNTLPHVKIHDGVHVVRDDLFAGGTKARFVPQLFSGADEVVYASPAEGGAQFALATVAQALGKRATIFVARRAQPHPRVIQAKALGAKVVQVQPGRFSVVQARARSYCQVTGAKLAPFGMDLPDAIDVIAAAAAKINIDPAEVWCAAGSGTLARSLAQAWPRAKLCCVQVGRQLEKSDVPARAKVAAFPRPFAWAMPKSASDEFPSDRHYDAKAWLMCRAQRSRAGLVVFWNVCGPPDQ